MKSLRKMTFGKAKKLASEVQDAWIKHMDTHGPDGWFEDFSQRKLSIYQKTKDVIGTEFPFKPVTKSDAFVPQIVSSREAYNDHHALLTEGELDYGEPYEELDIKDTCAFIWACDHFLIYPIPIYVTDSPSEVLCKVACAAKWSSYSKERLDYTHPFLDAVFKQGWKIGSEQERFFIETSKGTKLTFENEEDCLEIHDEMPVNHYAFLMRDHIIDWNNGRILMIHTQTHETEPMPLAVYAFIMTHIANGTHR